ISKAVGELETPLDVFTFFFISKTFFPKYEFIPFKVDGFIQEIKKLSPDITTQKFTEIIQDFITKVNNYAEFRFKNHSNNLNPYTLIRHCLFLFDENMFSKILFEDQKKNFKLWLS